MSRSSAVGDVPAIACARDVVGELIASGVRDAVLSPGSRSAPFAYVLHAADRVGLLRLHVRVDERTAGFLALGLAKAGECPVPVFTTSGTAAANLHPAVLEASSAGVPLIAVTADRPAALRHSGANQTTDQLHLFGTAVRGFAALEDSWGDRGRRAEVGRLVALATGVRSRLPGPVQLDVALSDPLVPHSSIQLLLPGGNPSSACRHESRPASDTIPLIKERPRPAASRPAAPVRLPGGVRTVVLVGDAPPAEGRRAAELAERSNLPLLAEASSNARGYGARGSGARGYGARGVWSLTTHRILLASPLAAEIERVVVFGRPTLSRQVGSLLARDDLELIVVSTRADWPDPGLRRPVVADAVELEPDASDWYARWADADGRLAAALERLLEDAARQLGSAGLTGPHLARAVSAALPPGGPLVVGSSSAIRDLDLAPARPDVGPVYANRGLAGIDGTLSTAAGIALATRRPTHALVGDLTFLHDLTGLVIGPEEPRPNLRIVVANDDGGSIFATIEHGRPELVDAYERLFGTPHHADLTGLARSLGITARRVRTADELTDALHSPPTGVEVVEAVVDRSGRRELDRAITALAAML